jgi:hypothetical protein
MIIKKTSLANDPGCLEFQRKESSGANASERGKGSERKRCLSLINSLSTRKIGWIPTRKTGKTDFTLNLTNGVFHPSQHVSEENRNCRIQPKWATGSLQQPRSGSLGALPANHAGTRHCLVSAPLELSSRTLPTPNPASSASKPSAAEFRQHTLEYVRK